MWAELRKLNIEEKPTAGQKIPPPHRRDWQNLEAKGIKIEIN